MRIRYGPDADGPDSEPGARGISQHGRIKSVTRAMGGGRLLKPLPPRSHLSGLYARAAWRPNRPDFTEPGRHTALAASAHQPRAVPPARSTPRGTHPLSSAARSPRWTC